MMEIGRMCVKIAGRDAGKKCVIVEVVDSNYVVIDGETRRRKCNVSHLEPLNDKMDLKEGADHNSIVSGFKKLGIEMKEKKAKKEAKGDKPKKQRRQKTKPAEEQKPVKKEEKRKKSEE